MKSPRSGWAKRLLPRGRFARGVTILAGSNALGQALALAASPLLTRLYSPAEFGLLAVYMSITTVLGVVLSYRYEMAISLPESPRDATSLTLVALGFVALNAALGLAAVLMFAPWIAQALNAPGLAPLLILLPPGMLLLGAFNVFRNGCIRQRAFAPIGRARLFQVVSSLAIQIGCARFGAIGLIGGQIASQGAGSLSLGRRALGGAALREVRVADLVAVVVRYRRFPLVSSWAALLNRTSAQLPPLMFIAYFGPVVAGLYALAARVLNTPAAVVSGAVMSVFLSSAAEEVRTGRLPALVERAHSSLALLSLPPLALVAIVAPDAFRVCFGAEWVQAGEIARWLAVLVYFSMVASPLGMLFAVLERQGEEFAFQVTLFAARFAAIAAGGATGDALFTMAIFTLASAVCYLGQLAWVGVRTGIGVGTVALATLRALGVAALLGAPAWVGVVLVSGREAWWWGVSASALLNLGWLVLLARRLQRPQPAA